MTKAERGDRKEKTWKEKTGNNMEGETIKTSYVNNGQYYRPCNVVILSEKMATSKRKDPKERKESTQGIKVNIDRIFE